jgi:hypothetical protein
MKLCKRVVRALFVVIFIGGDLLFRRTTTAERLRVSQTTDQALSFR